MRGTKLNFNKLVRQLLVVSCAFLTGSTTIFSEGAAEQGVSEKINSSKVYYVTWQINRDVGPFLRQIKTRITSVPAPHNDVKLYDGRQWDEFVDVFLTKKDSSSTQPFPVMIPLPAACFDRNLSADKKDACLKDPASFGDGFVELGLQEVRSFKSLADIVDSNGVPATEAAHRFYNQDRWVNIIKNLNPKLDASGMIRPGTVLIFPKVVSLSQSSSAMEVPVVVDAEASGSQNTASNIISIRPDDAANVISGQSSPSLAASEAPLSQQSSQQNLGSFGSKSKIYFTTISIDRKAGPYLKQIIAKIGDVPSPYDSTDLYDGRTWEDMVDALLTKQDSSIKKPIDVMVPLPAGCFALRFSTPKKDACLKNPINFAAGALTLGLHTVGDRTTLDTVLAANGVPASSKELSFYNRPRWASVVQNFNPGRSNWSSLGAGDAIVLPKIISVGEAMAASDGTSLDVLGSSVDKDAIAANSGNPEFVEASSGESKPTPGYYTAVEAAAAQNAARVAQIAELARAQKEAAEAEALRAKYEADYAEAIRRKNEASARIAGTLKPTSGAAEATEALKDAKAAEAAQAEEASRAAELSAAARAAEAAAAAEAAKAAEAARAAEAAKAAEAERISRAAAKAKAEEAARIAQAAKAAELAKAAEAARAAQAAEAARAAEAAKAAKAKKAAEALAAAKAAEAFANKVAMEAERSAKAAQAAKSAEEAVSALAEEAAERAKRLADAKRSMSGNAGDWERVPGKSVSLHVARNVLSSAKSPMLKKQSTATVLFAYSEDETMEWFGSAIHSSFVKANSESELLTRTDDPLEYFRFTNVDFGAKFYFQGLASNMELYAGLYARLAVMDLRYYISNRSDGVAYLLEDHTDHNLGLGITGGITFTKKTMRYRISAVKDLYEFVDQSLLIDRANNRFTASYYTPRPEGRNQSQRNYDFFLESETIDVHLMDEEANLHAQMKRFSVGLGLGVAW
jgi:hypothetical protein